MAAVSLQIAGLATRLECRALEGQERLGVAARFDLSLLSPEPVDPTAVLGKRCMITLDAGTAGRLVPGVVVQFSSRATTQREPARVYSCVVRSFLALLELSNRPRIFQHVSVPAIIRSVLEESGVPPESVVFRLSGKHAPRDYVVRYGESDATFVRRLCEEEGLYFHWQEQEGAELFVLEDTSSTAPDPLGTALPIVDDPGLARGGLFAFGCRTSTRRRPGKVTLRDHAYTTPAVALEGVAEAGTEVEKGVEVYDAPGRFAKPSEGLDRAARRLESLRADARIVRFGTSAVGLCPGLSFGLEPGPDYTGSARPQGKHLVVALTHRFSSDAPAYELSVEAIPLDVPFRLPCTTPRPRIEGLHSATVTGPAGSEIHTDLHGRVHVRFPWDREGTSDDKSSLPIRTMQPNTPGSMILPRVGWEVLVMFEDGDPDRPVVIGKSHNAKQPPPHSLPANKTVTSLATLSSPGGGKQNSIHFDDAAGRQNVAIGASFAKTTSVANNMMTQTANNETLVISASQGRVVSAKESVSVTQSYIAGVGSQSAVVGGMQKIYVKGDMVVGVGTETVVVGGAVLEKVGNPVAGAKALAKSVALAGVSQLGVAGDLFARGEGFVEAGIDGYKKNGWKGAAGAVGGAAVNMAVAELVPGGDAVMGTLGALGLTPPWQEKEGAKGAQTGGGGTSGATDGAGAKGPGPGHRDTNVKGAMTELIGGSNTIVTPGNVGWTTTGPSTMLIGGSHSTLTRTAANRTMGASTETLGSLKITTTGAITREIKGAMATQVKGALKSDAGGVHAITAGASLSVKIGGSLTLNGSKVSFVCGSSTVTAAPGGVLIKADTVKITGASKQSGKTSHE